jgi:L-fuconolactonase
MPCTMLTRRNVLVLPFSALAHSRPRGTLIDTHIHLFAADQKRFPFHKDAVYKPEPATLESYKEFVKKISLDHAIIVHPEPYQDDHSYLAHCFANEPVKGFLKGTCLFDPIAPATPSRMAALVRKNPGRIVALRIHENRKAGVPPTTGGPIRDRDLTHPAMKKTWRAATDLGLAIQMHLIPLHAPELTALASEFRNTTVLLDHMARAKEGTPEEYQKVLAMAKLPKVYIKFSGPGFTYEKKLIRQTYDAFGPHRMMWGGLGMDLASFNKNAAIFDAMFDFTSETERELIRGLNAKQLFRF